MNVKELPKARSLTDLLRLVLPALASVIAILATKIFLPSNASLFIVAPCAVAIAFLAFEAALRVKTNFLFIVALQILAFSVVLAWLTGQLSGSISIVTNLTSSIISFVLGLIARAVKDAEEKQTSRYFELAIKNQELTQTRLSILRQDEADRRILASDLHDQVLNEIKQIKSKVIALPNGQELNKENIAEIEASLDTAGRHIREVMESLFPSVLENLGLCTALDQLTRDSCQKAGIQGRFLKTVDDAHLEKLTKTEELLLFRLTQEALNNVIKHAQARTVRVNFENKDKLTLSIIDDGIGFTEKERGNSRGLRYMRLRADLIGATISWQVNLTSGIEQENKGTIVKIELA
ncbi:hypothetical protein BH11CYA1_BH11CYA1_29420 [soil metagenome]